MKLKNFDWTYGQLADGLSCFDEIVEIVNGVLANSATLQQEHPESALHVAALRKNIEDIKQLKKQFATARVEYYMQFYDGSQTGPVDLATLAIAPFRKPA